MKTFKSFDPLYQEAYATHFSKYIFCETNQPGFSIEGGTRRLIAAYFGIYSRLLCV